MTYLLVTYARMTIDHKSVLGQSVALPAHHYTFASGMVMTAYEIWMPILRYTYAL